MLTQEQKIRLYKAGENDTYSNEQLCDGALQFIQNDMPEIKEEDQQEAIEIYCNGFLYTYHYENSVKEILKKYRKGIDNKEITNPLEFLIDEFAYLLEDNPNFNEKEFRKQIYEKK